jgi:hypothetical protein
VFLLLGRYVSFYLKTNHSPLSCSQGYCRLGGLAAEHLA